MDRDQLIQRIKEARIEAGLSQREAAEKAAIAQPTWANVENGERTVAAPTLVKMAAAVGLSVSYTPETFTVGKKSSPRK